MQPMDFFLVTQEQIRNSRGKRATSVRATEVLLYYFVIKPAFSFAWTTCSRLMLLLKNICCDPSSELSRQEGSDEGSHHMALMRK